MYYQSSNRIFFPPWRYAARLGQLKGCLLMLMYFTNTQVFSKCKLGSCLSYRLQKYTFVLVLPNLLLYFSTTVLIKYTNKKMNLTESSDINYLTPIRTKFFLILHFLRKLGIN